MTNYEIISTLISILALCVSFYALYLSQKRGKISIQFRIKFYQLIVDIVNVGGNPLVITDIDISLHRNGEDIVSVFPENLPNLPVELRSKGVIRLKNFTESIDTALKQYS